MVLRNSRSGCIRHTGKLLTNQSGRGMEGGDWSSMGGGDGSMGGCDGSMGGCDGEWGRGTEKRDQFVLYPNFYDHPQSLRLPFLVINYSYFIPNRVILGIFNCCRCNFPGGSHQKWLHFNRPSIFNHDPEN